MGNDGDLIFLKVQSLRSHHDQLKVLIASLNRQSIVIALCKTWLSDIEPLDLYHLDGYQKGVFVNRKNSRGGGLVLFFLKTTCLKKFCPMTLRTFCYF